MWCDSLNKCVASVYVIFILFFFYCIFPIYYYKDRRVFIYFVSRFQ